MLDHQCLDMIERRPAQTMVLSQSLAGYHLLISDRREGIAAKIS